MSKVEYKKSMDHFPKKSNTQYSIKSGMSDKKSAMKRGSIIMQGGKGIQGLLVSPKRMPTKKDSSNKLSNMTHLKD